MTRRPIIALTPGEPAGIGPDIVLALMQRPLACDLVLIADPTMLAERAALLHQPFAPGIWSGRGGDTPAVYVLPVTTTQRVTTGQLDTANSAYVIECLRRAVHGCMNDEFAALVTGPVHKGVINDAGFAFTGHTEYLADHSGTHKVVMMLAGGGLRVALATTHLPLREVADAITLGLLDEVIRILHADLQEKFGIVQPRILVAGLNPHAGESGHLGHEEIDIIEPALDRLRAQGMHLVGPLPADTLFSRIRNDPCDAVLAMYHDQGLPVLKYASFGAGVNITLGLPFIRTSVDHGTALDLAGTGRAEAGSLMTAIEVALDMVARRRGQ